MYKKIQKKCDSTELVVFLVHILNMGCLCCNTTYTTKTFNLCYSVCLLYNFIGVFVVVLLFEIIFFGLGVVVIIN